MVECRPLPKLPEVLSFFPRQFSDDRGSFSETFRDQWFEAQGFELRFCQDNQSFSAQLGTLRGLHFQTGSQAQAKLVRCISGRIWDVAVDLRPHSPTFGLWDGMELCAEGGEQLFVPTGFAHGFLTLTADCLVAYKCTAYYDRTAEDAIRYDDPQLAIAWPNLGVPKTLSAKDAKAGSFADFKSRMGLIP